MPRRGVAYSFSRGLYDATMSGHFRVNPTIVAGDFMLSKDGGAFVNLSTLPVVRPAGSALVFFQLTAAELTADWLTLLGRDQAGGEWTEYMEHFDTTTATEIADAVLMRDWTAIPTVPPAFSLWQALRFLRNAWTLSPGSPPVLQVRAEDGTTVAWTRQVATDPNAQPITGVS